MIIFKVLFLIFITSFFLILGFIYDILEVCSSVIILITYLLFRPQKFYHPNNIVFGFYFLYVIVPTLVLISIDETLIIKNFSTECIFDYMTCYFLYYFFIYFFTASISFKVFTIKEVPQVNYKIFILFVISIVLLLYFIWSSGGILKWLTDYKNQYLLGRDGLGVINMLLMSFGNATVFLLGYKYYTSLRFQNLPSKLLFILPILIFIICLAYAQGLKSRLIYLLIIFSFYYLKEIKLSVKNLLLLFSMLLLLFYGANYVRSGGYYSNLNLFYAYLPFYFNTYNLHELIVSSQENDYFTTLHYTFKRPFDFIGVDIGLYFTALSNELTAKYFPIQWYEFQATQQWPIETEYYLNFGSRIFWLLPIISYSLFISLLYKYIVVGCNHCFTVFYLYEFLKFFSHFRGGLFEWQMWVYYPLYFLVCLFLFFDFKKYFNNNYIYLNSKKII